MELKSKGIIYRTILTIFILGIWINSNAQETDDNRLFHQDGWQNYSIGVSGLTSELWVSAYHPPVTYHIPVSVVVKRTGRSFSYRSSFTYYKDNVEFDSRGYSFDGAHWGKNLSHNYDLRFGVEKYFGLFHKLRWYLAFDMALMHINGISVNNSYSGWTFTTTESTTHYAIYGAGISPAVGLILPLSKRIDVQYELGGTIYGYYSRAREEREDSNAQRKVLRDWSLGTWFNIRPVQMVAVNYKFNIQ